MERVPGSSHPDGATSLSPPDERAPETGRVRRLQEGPVARVALARPEVRNAFDDALIEELTRAFPMWRPTPQTRVVVLSGEGPTFCAGADVAWMRKAGGYSRDENEADAERMARMLRAIDRCPKPVVALVHGAAIGGGVGLVAAADIAIAAEGTVFSLAEVKLGILPAVISPYVLRAIGPRPARDLFLTGDRFDAREAHRIGLVHASCPPTSSRRPGGESRFAPDLGARGRRGRQAAHRRGHGEKPGGSDASDRPHDRRAARLGRGEGRTDGVSGKAAPSWAPKESLRSEGRTQSLRDRLLWTLGHWTPDSRPRREPARRRSGAGAAPGAGVSPPRPPSRSCRSST